MTKTRKTVKRLISLILNVAILLGIVFACDYFYLSREKTVFVLGLYLAARCILWLIRKTIRGIQDRMEERREQRARNPVTVKRKRGSFFRVLAIMLAGLLIVGGAAAVKKQLEIPDALLALKEKYPETADFVNAYPWKKNRTFDMDISDEVSKGTIPLFLQWDERWGYQSYGGNFIGVNACGPTSLSMVVCGLTGNTRANPYEVAKYSEQMGYYVPGEGTSWELMTSGAESYGLAAEAGEASYDYITNALMSGKALICSMWPGDFTYTGHFIVLTGIDADGNILLNDPNSRQNSEKSWTTDVLLPQIRAVWSYSYEG